MAEWIQDFIRHSPLCVMATSNAGGDCDASPKGGRPGFVKIVNDKQLFLPDVAGNKLFHGYGNVESNPKVGLIFLIPGHDNTVRINGRAKVVDRAELKDVQVEVFNADERAEVLQGLLIDVDESCSHCPRALKFFQAVGHRANCQAHCHAAATAEGAGDLASLWQVCWRVNFPSGGENAHSVVPSKNAIQVGSFPPLTALQGGMWNESDPFLRCSIQCSRRVLPVSFWR